ncbi:MAG: hypothetical protein AMXMBFR82_31690 [Candidatus Hydrogenedentota bacterium]
MPELIEVTNEFAPHWAGVMWAAVWQSSILAAAVLGITLLLRRFSPSLRYWLWMLVVLRLLVVPLGTVSLPILPALNESVHVDGPAIAEELLTEITATPGAGGFGAGSGVPGLSAVELPPAPSSPQQAEPARTLPKPSLPTIVFAVWVLGILAAAGRLAWTWSQTRRIVHHATAPSCDTRLSTLASRIAYAMGLRRAPRIGITGCSVSPFVFGVIKPVVILPRQLVERADDGQLAAVLAHEFAHLRRFDPLFGWLFSLCHAAYFFHPALILVKRQLLIERERACDDYALAISKARPSEYARALVSVAELCSAPATAVGPLLVVAESFADLKTRLVALQRQTRPQARLSIGALAVLIALATVTVPGIALTNRAPELATAVVHDMDENFQVAQAPVARVEPTRNARVFAPPQHIPVDGRVLHFPSDRTLGTIRIMDSDFERTLDTFYHWLDDSEWVDWSTARGDVVIPEGKHVWLVLNPRACSDLSGLQQLQPNDIFKLSVDYTERGGPSLDDTGMAHIAHLTGIRYLHLRWSNVTDAGLVFLPELYRLERLQVPRYMTDAGMAQIARAPWLKALYLSETPVTDAGMAYLEKLSGLRELSIDATNVGDAGLAYLTYLAQLDYLMLGGAYFTDYGMEQLKAAPSIRILNVSRLGISDRGVQHLAALPNLEVLSLYGIPALTNESLAHLGQSQTLRKLDLSVPAGDTSRIHDEGFAALATCPNLEHLCLPPTFSDRGLASVAKLKGLKYLHATNSSRGALSDAGLRSIAELPVLEELHVTGGDGITDAGIARIGGMQSLRTLMLMSDSRNFTDAGVAELARLTNLTSLELFMTPKYCPVTKSGLNHLNRLTNLRFLSVLGGRPDDSVLDLSALYEMENLTIGIPELRDEDVAFVAKLPNLKWLQGIRGISDEGMAFVAGLTRLERLNIGGPTVTDDGLRHLRGLKVLNHLSVEGNFTDAGLRQLEANPLLRMVSFEGGKAFTQEGLERFVMVLPHLATINQQPVHPVN